ILIPYKLARGKSREFENSLENALDPFSPPVEPLLAQSDDALELPRNLPFDQRNSLWGAEIDTHLAEMCFFVRTDTQLTGVDPIMKYVGETEPGCILACARNKRCHSVNYSGTMSTCEIFDEMDFAAMQISYRLATTSICQSRRMYRLVLKICSKPENTLPMQALHVTTKALVRHLLFLTWLTLPTRPPTHYRLVSSK
ncbi:PAN domain protein, partial [Ostertagia ostertagi]